MIPIVFFFGGRSSEHEISCLTMAGILDAIDRDRYEPHGVGITKDGAWVRYGAAELSALCDAATVEGAMPVVDGSLPEAVLGHGGGTVWLATRQGDRLIDEVDVQVGFPMLHGPFGEDGTLQGMFEMMGLRYVGAGVAASAMGMDKHLSKMAFGAAGLPVWPWIVASVHEDAAVVARRVDSAGLGYPVYVKPLRGGSSVGISRVDTVVDLAAAVVAAGRFDSQIIIEKAVIGGREIECGVLGPATEQVEPRVSRPGEIVVHRDDAFYDYEAKYLDPDEAELRVPADLSADVEARVRDVARRAFESIGGEGLSRVDSFVLPDGQVVINEINTMPGFTAISMFPMLWRCQGMSYRDLITDLIEQARRRPLASR